MTRMYTSMRGMALHLFFTTYLTTLSVMLLVPVASADQHISQLEASNFLNTGTYQTSKLCSNCHKELFKQFEKSMHAKAFVNPIFQKQFNNVFLSQLSEDLVNIDSAGSCLGCHSPTIYVTHKSRLPDREELGNSSPGVTCDFCHTIIGYKGDIPGNANYIPLPGPTKYGPLESTSNWHREYSVFQTKSEACAVCHEATNRNGVRTHTTYSEWKMSSWPEKGIQCQDCHMSAPGRLIDGRPVFDQGVVAKGTLITPKHRGQVHNHQFPGAHVNSQLKGAAKLRVYIMPKKIKPGTAVLVGVELDNSEAGHSLPTGAVELRLAWLDVKLRMLDSGREIQLKARPTHKSNWDISGMNSLDNKMLQKEIKAGSRLYRAIVVDKDGAPTLNNWEAVDKVFDNRIEAGEKRRERYRYLLPATATGSIEVSATLRYFRYPPGFLKRLGVSPEDSVLVSSVSKTAAISD